MAVIFSQQLSAKISFSYQDFAPFSYQKKGRAQGIMIELTKLICVEMKQQCEFNYYPNKRAKDYMAKGLVHGNLPLGWNVSRKEWIHFSVPLVTTSYSFFGLEEMTSNIHNWLI
ncbi:MAG: transporter substrate-binding domain-containing protein [Oceanospirillaceae bacterium]|nr:transporter substrate-binding domain-containing protein [Oceanospirillaceae bacterium]